MNFLTVLLVSIFMSANAMAANFSCHGTEPFWGAKVSSETIELNGPDYENPAKIVVTSVSGASGMVDSFLRVYSNKNGPIAIITSNKCDNGMSDETFPHEIILFTDSETLYGCCE
ncbi:MAG: hypothetical protein M9962_15320 [Oligoflexia bacterium]|nr:hypothetical protein [Oligoflexia bacterium]